MSSWNNPLISYSKKDKHWHSNTDKVCIMKAIQLNNKYINQPRHFKFCEIVPQSYPQQDRHLLSCSFLYWWNCSEVRVSHCWEGYSNDLSSMCCSVLVCGVLTHFQSMAYMVQDYPGKSLVPVDNIWSDVEWKQARPIHQVKGLILDPILQLPFMKRFWIGGTTLEE